MLTASALCVFVSDGVKVEAALSGLLQEKQLNSAQLVHHTSAYDEPHHLYDPHRKHFVTHDASTTHSSLLASATDKAAVHRERYQLILQRCLNNPLFASSSSSLLSSSSVLSASAHSAHRRAQPSFHLSTIESLVGTKGKRCILGMLTQLHDGCYYLEDPQSVIQIEFSESFAYPLGYLTDHCFVLAEGEMLVEEQEVFRLDSLCFPPIETRAQTLSLHRELRPPEQLTQRLSSLLEIRVEDFIVLISDLYLDQRETIDKLKQILEVFNAAKKQPAAIVLTGCFLSPTFHPTVSYTQTMTQHMDMLAHLLVSYPVLNHHTQFIIQPSTMDSMLGSLLPVPPLSNRMTHALQQQLHHLVLASNPHRMNYYGRSICLYRDNLLAKLRRRTLLKPLTVQTDGTSTREEANSSTTSSHVAVEENEAHQHYMATLLAQAHLSPLPLEVNPICWDFDHSLSLYPLPELLVLQDRCAAFVYEHEGCLVVNGGSFGKDGSFAVYYPAEHRVEPSQV